MKAALPRPSLGSMLRRKARTAWRLALGWIYQDQVSFLLPTAMAPADPAEISCPTGYSLRCLAGRQDHTPWLELLNKDSGFGHWDETRLQNELVNRLFTPDSAGFLFKDRKLVGSAAICATFFRGRLMPAGMFLILDPECRGSFKLANALFNFNLYLSAREGYSHVFVSTYPDRLTALTLYLASGAQCCHTSVWSYVQWNRIQKRLGPTVARLKKKLDG